MFIAASALTSGSLIQEQRTREVSVPDGSGLAFSLSNVLLGSVTETNPLTPTGPNPTGVIGDGMNAAFYNRLLLEPIELNFGTVASQQAREFTIFNAFFNDVQLDSLTVNQDTGLSIAGEAGPFTLGALQELEYIVTATADGPPSVIGTYAFNFLGAVDDVTVTASGSRTVMLPFVPGEGYGESLEFGTYIATTRSGLEQRSRVRRVPIQRMNATMSLRPDELAFADNLLNGWRGRNWAVPVWQEARDTGLLLEGDTVIQADTTNADFRVDGLAVIYINSRLFDVFQIESFTDNNLTITRGLSFGAATAKIMPVRVGIMEQDPTRVTSGVRGTLSSEVTVLSNVALIPPAYPQYKNADVYTMPVERVNNAGVTDVYTTRVDIIGTPSSAIRTVAPWGQIKKTRTFRITLDTPELLWQYRLWLHRRSGRLREFWIPSFESDFRVIGEGPLGNRLECQLDNYSGFNTGRMDIAIKLKSGAWEFFEVLSANDSPVSTILNLAETTLTTYEEIDFVSHFSLVRLNTDRVEIQWGTNFYATSTIPTIEVPL